MMRKPKPMTPDQYRGHREKLGMTQAELAEILGLRNNTISRREKGASDQWGSNPITREADLAMRYLVLTCKP